jgi:hypothetical protein
MKIESTYWVKGRGPVICVTLDCDEPTPGTSVVRTRDRLSARIKAVEFYAIGRRPRAGDNVGLLLEWSAEFETGDEIDLSPPDGA